jgi:hypothetical protein
MFLTGVDLAGLPGISSMADFYSASRSGNWSWVKDSVMYNIKDITSAGGAARATATLGLWDAGNYNVTNSAMPIAQIVRDTTPGTSPAGMQLVTFLDPRPAGAALTSVTTAPDDGFFTPVNYRGAFAPGHNWLEGWTAIAEYGMTTDSNESPSATIAMTASIFWQSVAGAEYLVEETTDLDNGPWVELATVVGDGSIMTATDIEGFSDAKFYRVVLK